MSTVADDNAGFDSFYERELTSQVRRAAMIVGSDETANDLVHEAFVQVFRRWGELDNPGGYLNRAVLNGCRDAVRRSGRRGRKRHLVAVDERATSSAIPEHITDALLTLPFNHRASLVLRYYFDMATEEIADQLHCAPGSVGPWITRGLATLRKVLA